MAAKPVTWRVLRTSTDPKFMVKGYELADTFLHRYRFRVAEVRAMIRDDSFDGYHMGVMYRVFDAAEVSDADLRGGKSAPCVATLDTFDQAQAYCDARA